jgi:oligopeptide/dipeptide ABC transporter ATP-binding protein
MTLLEVRNLKKYYPVRQSLFGRSRKVLRAVDGITFSVDEGESLGIVGESGCGKTTAGRCILRLIEPTLGEVRFEGRDLLRLAPGEVRSVRRHMQMIFQDPFGSLNPRMSIGAILEEPLVIHRLGAKKERSKRVDELLEMVGLDASVRSRYPHEFSGGQRQRIGIARSLALNPRLIVADEPVSSLDVSVQAQIVNLLKELQEHLKLTFVFIAHDLSVVEHFCDRIAVMYLGRIVELAPSLDLFRTPAHPYTRLLLSSVPVPDPAARPKREGLRGEVPAVFDPPSGCRFHPRCPIAVDRCRTEDPALRELSPGHQAACHLA